MDKESGKLIEAAAERAAEKLRPLIEEASDKAAEKVRHHFDASTEQIVSEIKALGEGEDGNAERLDEHDKRIERLEDRAGLPTLEPVVDS